MGIHLEPVNHDELFQKANIPPIIVNDYDLQSKQHIDRFNSLVYTTYSGDSLEVLPQCGCGETYREHNIGVTCPNCGEMCLPVTERPLESALWIAAPRGVRALMNPEMWIILNERLTVSKVSVLQWLTNPHMTIQGTMPRAIEKLIAEDVPRGLNHFVDEFDDIIDLLINGKIVTKDDAPKRRELLNFIDEYRDCIFCQHLNVPSRLAIIVERSPTGGYADNTMKHVVQAVRTISSIENAATPMAMRTRESRTVKAMMHLAEFYNTFYAKTLGQRTGWFRKHVYGSRARFSFRGVISSISEPFHHYEEVHMPWSMSVLWLQLYLKRELMILGYTPDEASAHIYEHTLKYSSLLDRIFNKLINEWVGDQHGIPIALQRNPSLTRGSLQTLRVTRIQTNVKVNTIRLSVLVLAAANADFDGDQLNGLLLQDRLVIERFERHKPHLYAMDQNKPHQLAGYLQLPAPTVANIASWLHADTQ